MRIPEQEAPRIRFVVDVEGVQCNPVDARIMWPFAWRPVAGDVVTLGPFTLRDRKVEVTVVRVEFDVRSLPTVTVYGTGVESR